MPTEKPDQYFLVIYDLSDQEVEVLEFGNDLEEASNHYAMYERRFADQPMSEVVLLGADSIETIHKTHSHYFAKASEDLFEQLLAELQKA